jgi:hypothetical protein
VRGRTKRVLPPPHKTNLYTKVDLLLQSTQLIGNEDYMTLSIEEQFGVNYKLVKVLEKHFFYLIHVDRL